MRARHGCPFGLAVMLVGLGPASPARAGDVTSTRQFGAPFEWSNVSRWNHEPAVSTFPNNGNDGHTFDVIVNNGNLVTLDQAITIDSLFLHGAVEVGGNTFDILGDLQAIIATLTGGTVSAHDVTITSTNLSLNDTFATFQSVEIQNNATLLLDGGTVLDLSTTGDEIRFTGGGDVISLNGSLPIINFSGAGATIHKTGGGVSDITATVVSANELFVQNDAQNSTLRFNQHSQAWNDLSVTGVVGTLVDFSVPLTVGNIAVNSDGIVEFNGDVVLGGTLTSTAPEFGTVVISTLGDAGSLSGGITNCASSCPLVLDDASRVGLSGMVTNIGSILWRNAAVTGGGLRNEGVIETAPAAPGERAVTGATLANAGDVTNGDPIVLGTDGKIDNEAAGTWTLDANIQPQEGALVPTTEFTSAGVLTVGSENAPAAVTIGVPFDATNQIVLKKSLTTTDSTRLHDVTIRSLSGRSMKLTPGGAPDGAELSLAGLIIVDEEGPDINQVVLRIEGGDYTLDGTIMSDGDAAAGAALAGGSLSGGILDIGDPADESPAPRFGHIAPGVLGNTAAVTNIGRYALISGEIGPGGLVNQGFLDINSLSDVTITNLTNQATVKHSGSISIRAPGIASSGIWTANAAIDPVEGARNGAFVNTGSFIANGLVTVDVFFDSPGRVIADAAIVIFTATVAQFNTETGELSGGTFEERHGGKILFNSEGQVGRVRDVAAEAHVTLADTVVEGPTWDGVEVIDGTLHVVEHAEWNVSDNDQGGDLEIEFDGELGDGEAILGPGLPARTIMNRLTNRGRAVVYNNGVIQASTAVDLLDGGALTGDFGIVETPIVNNASGIVDPGFPADFDLVAGPADTTGQITIDGEYDQSVDGTLRIELAGPTAGDFDRLIITGAATLGGMLELVPIDGYEPQPEDAIEILTAASVSGTFEMIVAPFAVDVSYEADRVVLTPTGPGCLPDLDGSGDVGPSDLAALLGAWGSNPGHPADFDGDGAVGAADLATLLGNWGGCVSSCG